MSIRKLKHNEKAEQTGTKRLELERLVFIGEIEPMW